MRPRLDMRALRQTRWYQFAIRFAVGGAATAFAGLVAKKGGPTVGGLFLAFPAIFAASITLVEKHHSAAAAGRSGGAGHRRRDRGRRACCVDAAGTFMASVGLASFAVCVWQLAGRWPPSVALAFATLVWALVSGGIWFARRWLRSDRPS